MQLGGVAALRSRTALARSLCSRGLFLKGPAALLPKRRAYRTPIGSRPYDREPIGTAVERRKEGAPAPGSES